VQEVPAVLRQSVPFGISNKVEIEVISEVLEGPKQQQQRLLPTGQTVSIASTDEGLYQHLQFDQWNNEGNSVGCSRPCFIQWFREVKKLVEQERVLRHTRRHHKKIVETLGEQWLKKKELNKSAYVCINDDFHIVATLKVCQSYLHHQSQPHHQRNHRL
jgi:hypothetical protein